MFQKYTVYVAINNKMFTVSSVDMSEVNSSQETNDENSSISSSSRLNSSPLTQGKQNNTFKEEKQKGNFYKFINT